MAKYPTLFPTIFDFTAGEDEMEKAQSFLEKRGFVLCKLLTKKECEELIIEQWQNIIGAQPWKPEFRINYPDPVTRRGEFLEFALKTLEPKERAIWEKGWPMHTGFGACCDPMSFNSQKIWEVRQKENTYKFVSRLLGHSELWVDINRSIQKLPGKGDAEFLHWDWSPWNEEEEEEAGRDDSVSGKVTYNQTSTIICPGSHKPQFIEKFKRLYAGVYAAATTKKNAPKFGMKPSLEDPLDLFNLKAKNEGEYFGDDFADEMCYSVQVPRGCWLLWNKKTLHGTNKTPTKGPVEYGMYLGYMRAGSRREYEDKAKIDELSDRLNSVATGKPPELWPSLDRVHFYPARFMNFPKPLVGLIARMEEGHPSITSRWLKNKQKEVPHLRCIVPETYKAPSLSNLGKKLLGMESFAQKEEGSDDQREGKEVAAFSGFSFFDC